MSQAMQKGGKRVGFGFRNGEPMISYAYYNETVSTQKLDTVDTVCVCLNDKGLLEFAGAASLTFSSCRLHAARFL